MSRRAWIDGYRVVFASLASIAIGYQFLHSRDTVASFRVGNFFSFFTIESNILAVLVLLVAAWLGSNERRSPRFDVVRGAAVVYMATTGVVYGLLLTGYQEALQTTVPWVDTVLHRVLPIVMVADWLIEPPTRRIELRDAAVWLIYPFLYLVYSLIRGPIVSWYPYPFLDPDVAGGYGAVALYSVGIAIGIGFFVWVVAALSRRSEATAPAY